MKNNRQESKTEIQSQLVPLYAPEELPKESHPLSDKEFIRD